MRFFDYYGNPCKGGREAEYILTEESDKISEDELEDFYEINELGRYCYESELFDKCITTGKKHLFKLIYEDRYLQFFSDDYSAMLKIKEQINEIL